MRSFGPAEIQLLALGFRSVVFQLFFELFSHLHPGTRLAGLCGLGAKTLHKGHLAVKVFLEGAGFTLTLGVVFVLKGQKLRVGGLAEHGLGQPEVENVRADIIHELVKFLLGAGGDNGKRHS